MTTEGFSAARLAFIWLAIAIFLSGCALTADPPGQRFVSIGRAHEPAAGSVATWANHLLHMAARAYPGADALPDDHVLSPEEAARQLRAAQGAPLALTWFGHSTFLIRIGGRSILTDPQLTASVGTGPFRLPRLVPVLPDPDLIESLDAIVVSHADFDHFDLPTLKMLAARFPDAALHVPEGTARLARLTGFSDIVELPWYDSAAVGRVRVTAVPAIHSVRRPPFALDSMHWAGYVIEAAGRRVYFSGDTGAGTVFSDIRHRLGPVDYALVPAGGWKPHRFHAPYHVSPEEAVEVAETLGARLAIGMHWGTLALTAETGRAQKERFLAAGTRATPSAVMRIGETRVLR